MCFVLFIDISWSFSLSMHLNGVISSFCLIVYCWLVLMFGRVINEYVFVKWLCAVLRTQLMSSA